MKTQAILLPVTLALAGYTTAASMRNRWLIAMVAAIVAAPVLAAAQPVPMLPTNRPDVKAFPLPPANFDPKTATPRELQAYGLPPMPTDEKDLEMWQLITGSATTRIVPEFRASERFHGPVQNPKLQKPTLQSGGPTFEAGSTVPATASNWSGDAIINTRESNPLPFTNLVGLWTIPSVVTPSGQCTGLGFFAADWIGIDGAVNGNLVQAGTDSFVECGNDGAVNQVYQPWFEWLPNPEAIITNFSVQAGDGMASAIHIVDSTHANILLIDLTTGFNVAFQAVAPPGAHVVGQSAEWIHEALTVNGGISDMPAFGIAYFSFMQANLPNAIYPNVPGRATTLVFTMVQNGVRVAIPHLTGSAVQWILSKTGEQDVLGD